MDCECTTSITEAYDPDFLLRTALDVAVHTLRSGGEVHRVEETVERICYANGATHVEVFAINSMIIASVRMKDGSYASHTRRVLSIDSHMTRLRRFNEISRALCRREMTLEQAQAEIAIAKKIRPYSIWIELLGALICAAGFAILFDGTILDAVAAGIVSAITTAVIRLMPSSVNVLATMLISNFIAGLLSVGAVRLGLANSLDCVVISLIMPHVPGLTFGNAIRDLLLGDTLTGLLGLARALLIAVAIAFGLFLSFVLTGGVL